MLYNGHNSAAETVESGIPPGTVIGPASFLTFIDDITDDIVLDAQTQNGDEPVGEYSFSGQSCLSSADS